MKAALAALLAIGCSSSAAVGIAGDSSPDDPGLPPDETGGGKVDKPKKAVPQGTGVVMDAPTLVNVYWGAYWISDAGTSDRAVIDAFTASVGNSAWWQIVGEYPDRRGTLPGAPAQGAPAFASDSEPPARLHSTDAELHAFLAAQLAAGNLGYDAETLYTVFSAPGTKPPRGECGHHSYFSTSIDGKRRKVVYALVPYLTDSDSGCGVGVTVNGPSLDPITVTFSHEIAEALTDPYLDAWGKGSDNEIGDPCATGFAAKWDGMTYAVQDLWSNKAFACVHVAQ